MTLKGRSEFSFNTDLPIDEVVEVARLTLESFASSHQEISASAIESVNHEDIEVKISFRASSFAQLEKTLDQLAEALLIALQEREKSLRIHRGATEMVPA